eukprot:TRINITY_DN1073_c0_g1_i18.p1 TRINITY_DN1073_c0_g1~~TRINITY_DN1073_c0_g1_i18.p1  ORF type:complete len:245 (+),score=21.85 TRINITY_DN1073_c0_g1_i18:232-966(+)
MRNLSSVEYKNKSKNKSKNKNQIHLQGPNGRFVPRSTSLVSLPTSASSTETNALAMSSFSRSLALSPSAASSSTPFTLHSRFPSCSTPSTTPYLNVKSVTKTISKYTTIFQRIVTSITKSKQQRISPHKLEQGLKWLRLFPHKQPARVLRELEELRKLKKQHAALKQECRDLKERLKGAQEAFNKYYQRWYYLKNNQMDVNEQVQVIASQRIYASQPKEGHTTYRTAFKPPRRRTIALLLFRKF